MGGGGKVDRGKLRHTSAAFALKVKHYSKKGLKLGWNHRVILLEINRARILNRLNTLRGKRSPLNRGRLIIWQGRLIIHMAGQVDTYGGAD